MRNLPFRPLLLAAIVLAALLLCFTACLLALEVRHLERLRELQESARRHAELQDIGLALRRALLEDVRGEARLDRRRVAAFGEQVDRVIALVSTIDPEIAAELAAVGRLLAEPGPSPREVVQGAIRRFDRAQETSDQIQRAMVFDLRRTAQEELAMVGGILLALTLATVGGLTFFRHRILDPLGNLREFLSLLASGQAERISVERADPLLVPLFENYNRLVERLEELERSHRTHAEALEKEVEAATKTLLEQHHELARLERLAAVGELAAGLAHELRNPLAGVQVALGNLEREAAGDEAPERLSRITGELDRMRRLLDEVLARTRHRPEPPREVAIGPAVEDLLTLLSYQVPAKVRLVYQVEEGLRGRLSESRLRQALLNLILNSVQALAGEEGEIRVEAESAEEDLVISVTDSGPGFPPEYLAYGVQPFRSQRPTGTGLGLAMVQRFAHDAGGRMEVGNVPPRGARVTLRLPREGAR